MSWATSHHSLHFMSHGALSQTHALIHFFMCVLNTCVLGTLRMSGPIQGSAEITMSWT